MHVQNLINSLWDIRIFLGLVPKESPCTISPCSMKISSYKRLRSCFCRHKRSSDLVFVAKAFLYVRKCVLVYLRHRLNIYVRIVAYFYVILYDKYEIIFWSRPLCKCWYYLSREVDKIYDFESWTKQSKPYCCEEHGSSSSGAGKTSWFSNHDI